MCTKEQLYKQMQRGNSTLRRRRSRMMTLSQIGMATDCLRVLANRQNVSIGEMSKVIREKKLYPKFYALLNESAGQSKMKVVNQMQRYLSAE